MTQRHTYTAPLHLAPPSTESPSFRPEWIVKALVEAGSSRTDQEYLMLARFVGAASMRSLVDSTTSAPMVVRRCASSEGPWIALFTQDSYRAATMLSATSALRHCEPRTLHVAALLEDPPVISRGIAIDPSSPCGVAIPWEVLLEQNRLYKVYSHITPGSEVIEPRHVIPAVFHPELVDQLTELISHTPGVASAVLALTGVQGYARAATVAVDCVDSVYPAVKSSLFDTLTEFSSTLLHGSLELRVLQCTDEARLAALLSHGGCSLRPPRHRS